MHGVDQQSEIGPPDVFAGGQCGGQVADGQPGHRFDDGLDAALGGKFRQDRELVEGAAQIGIEAHDVDQRNTELGQCVEIRGELMRIGAGQHQEPVAERDVHAAVIHGGKHVAPECGVLQRERRITQRRQWQSLHDRRNKSAAEISGEIDELHRRKAECAEKADSKLVHFRSGKEPYKRPGRVTGQNDGQATCWLQPGLTFGKKGSPSSYQFMGRSTRGTPLTSGGPGGLKEGDESP